MLFDVADQAYKEVVEDGHPILIVTASDIASVLRANSINSNDVEEWMKHIDSTASRLEAYYTAFSNLRRK